MSKPEDIPQDVWDVAKADAIKYVEWVDPPPVEGVADAAHVLAVTIARAILAERERCASYIERRPGDINDRQFLANALRIGDAYNEAGKFIPSPARTTTASPSQGVTDAV